jgi:hypothetical protein
MDSSITLLVAVVIIGVLAAVVVMLVQHQARMRRRGELVAAAASAGWTFTEQDDGLARTWSGKPFSGRRGRARNVLIGRHRGRDFTAFEYSYTTTSSNGTTTTTTTHTFAVVALTLPAAAPQPFEVGDEGIFGGTVAKAFGVNRLDIADQDFNRAFKVKCDDETFGRAVLQPPLVDYLRSTGPWEWRFEGNAMIAFDTGALEAATLGPKLDLMSEVLDRVPAAAWGLTR